MKHILLKYLEKTGKTAEFDLFLNYYLNIPKQKFALIKISGETIENHLDDLADDIAFLNKLELYPLIVHGGGVRLNRELANSKKIDGIRVTPEEDINKVKETFLEIGESLKKKIIEKGGKAELVYDSMICDYLDKDKYGFVGKVKNVNTSKIESIFNKKATPIISPLGILENDNNIYLNINADTVAKELVKSIGIRKHIFITETGGVLNNNGNIMPFLNISSDEDMSFISGGMLLKINEIKEYIHNTPDVEVIITSANNIIQEIFTIKGSGTYIKDYVIKSTNDISELDKDLIKEVLEDAFGKKLVDNYFDEPIKEIFYQKDFEAIAIIKEINSIPYLCKFAVSKIRQGTGLGKSLWNKVVENYPSLIWRSHYENKVNAFYLSQSSGMMKKDKWHIFWRDVKEDGLMESVNSVLNLKETFISKNIQKTKLK